MDVRRGTTEDLETITAMRLAFLEEDSGPLSPDQRQILEKGLPGYFRAHLDRDLLCYLAVEAGAAASMVLLLVGETPPNLRIPTGRTGTLLNVYTRPWYRRRGLAERLLRMALDEGGRLGLSFLELQATPLGEPLYRKLGFSLVESHLAPMRFPYETM